MHDFIIKLIKNSVLQFLTIIVVMAMFVALAIVTVSVLGNMKTKSAPKDSVLTIDMGMEIYDTPETPSPLGQLFAKGGSDRASLLSLVDAIYKAADDKHIKAILLCGARPDMPDTGLSTILELRDAIACFREKGKPVYAYVQDMDMREYALASSADHLWMNPSSSLGLEGFSVEKLYFGEAFKRYGIGVQTASAGKYKSAPDTFASDRMRPEDREQLEVFLKDVTACYKELIVESRKVTISTLDDIEKNRGMLPAKAAVELKLVDRLAYYDELIGELQHVAGADGDFYRGVDIRDYMARENASDLAARFEVFKPKVRVEYIEGEIVDGSGGLMEAGCDRIVDDLRALRHDKKVKAVVLRVNSPGGSVVASEKIRREVELLSAKCPVVVSMGRMAASGGYWISAPAKKIYAEPTTLTGSIGVFSMMIDVKKLGEDWGVHAETVATTPYAGMYSLFSHKDDKQMQIFKDSVDDFYDQFLNIVAKGRKMDVKRVAEIAEGRIWSGAAARKLGLVDEIGSLDDAIDDAADIAGLGDDYSVDESTVERSFRDEFDDIIYSKASAGAKSPMMRLAAKVDAVAAEAENTHVFARLPFFTQGVW
jgi:protease IV